MTIPLLPFWMTTFNIGYLQAQFIVTISTIPLMFAGWMGEKMLGKMGSHPIRNILLLSIAIIAACTLLTPFAPDFYSLLIIRFIFGFGFTWIFNFPNYMLPNWFGMTMIPQLVVIGVCGMIVGFFMSILYTTAINGTFFAFNYNSCILYFYGPIAVATALCYAIFLKEAPQ